MEQLKKDIAEFHVGFEDLLVSLHKAFLDIKSKIKSEKLINKTLESGKSRLAELDKLIDQCMQNLSENEDLQEDLMQFLVSYRPRLENEINLIEDSIKNPADYEETVQQDDELSQMLKEAEAEILRTIQDEKDKMEQLKIQQIKKQTEDELVENQRLFEQQEQMRQALKNYENQQKEQQKNSWLQEGEFQSYIETKRKNHSQENKFNFDTTDNWSFQDDDNENANTNDKDEEDEEETTNDSYENEQELANQLLFQFLGIPIENQYIESEMNENVDEKKESENAEEKNQIENEKIKNEENQTEKNKNKENEENQTESNTNKENEEIKNEENQTESNEKTDIVVSTE